MQTNTIALLGAGGMASEILNWVTQSNLYIDYLYDSTILNDGMLLFKDDAYTISPIIRPNSYHIIAVGYPEKKVKLMSSIKEKINLSKVIIHPSCALGHNIYIDDGSIVCPNSAITANVIIGKLSSINTLVTIGHDCKIGEMFHASPGASVSGCVTIGNRVFLGTNACIKEKITICDDVVIGAGSVVINDIIISGNYAGNPARKIDNV